VLTGHVLGTMIQTMLRIAVVIAVAWSAGLGLIGYLWAKRLFNRDPTP
jgi:ABC-2 type transport system permease protein